MVQRLREMLGDHERPEKTDMTLDELMAALDDIVQRQQEQLDDEDSDEERWVNFNLSIPVSRWYAHNTEVTYDNGRASNNADGIARGIRLIPRGNAPNPSVLRHKGRLGGDSR